MKNTGNIILTHLVFNNTELNNDDPQIVFQATNEPGSFERMETALYGESGDDSPPGEMIWCYVPEHIGRLFSTNPDAIIGYLLMKIGETVGYDVPYGIERFNNPDTGFQSLAIVPYETEQYNIPELLPKGNAPRKFFPTFGEAMKAASLLKDSGQYNAIEISAWDAKGAIIGEFDYHYDEEAINNEVFQEDDDE